VCKFFVATIQKDHTSPEMSRIVLVMAICYQNLRSVIFHDDFIHPANAFATSAIGNFLQWALQIANALS
jgi:hypothetical protein